MNIPKGATRLVWADINLQSYGYNLTQIRKLTGPKVKLMAVVKANAYGHGIERIAQAAEKFGADWLGCVCLAEVEKIRQAKVRLPILILNYLNPGSISAALKLKATINVMDKDVLQEVDRKARKLGIVAFIHVKFDTGMHRAGCLPEEGIDLIRKIENFRNVRLRGVFTHLATADEKDLSHTNNQLAIFERIIKSLLQLKIHPPLIHAANSAVTLRLPHAYYSMVRPGIITYGLAPSADFTLPFKPKTVLSLKTVIVQIREIDKGEAVGYGRQFIASKKTRVGLLPVGYGDGFRRGPCNFGFVLVNGQKSTILGRVSMDQTSIDLSRIPKAQIGDEVVLIGKQGTESVSVDDVAKTIGTINYEVVTALLERVYRRYLD